MDQEELEHIRNLVYEAGRRMRGSGLVAGT